MKIKDLERTANIAWSPSTQYPTLLATGTAAQQLDASFNTNACLELYSLNFSDPGLDLELKAAVPSENRFYKLVWGSYGVNKGKSSGVIVGGCDGGIIQIYNASKLLSNEDCLISRQSKHNGPVQSLDFNPFQQNLLATGAAESEIYIWDLNNTNTPMTPGTKSQPFENVQSLSWNRQVQHILATTFSSRCVVWDLRKNEPIIKLSDTSSHIRWKCVSWHPDVATQLCLASEEDQTPVIQLWDLRFATSPLNVLSNHQRGVLSIAWCLQDPDLLISCGKDNRILCWNPNSNEPRGEVLSEVAHTLQWNFDVAWCPRNPAVIAASSFDGHVAIYSLMGGKQQQLQTTDKIADSFPGMDGFIQAPTMQQTKALENIDLSKAPKWMKRPVGASFAFGGRLITFEHEKQITQQNQVSQKIVRLVYISQVMTEPELIKKSEELEEALQSGNYSQYCRFKADSAQTQHEKYIWHFLKAYFEPDRKMEWLDLLGFNPNDVSQKLKQFVKKPTNENMSNNYGDHLANLSQEMDFNATFDAIAAENKNVENSNKKITTPYIISTGNDTDGLIAQAILMGHIEEAVEFCIEANRMADALIIAMTGGSELLARTQFRYFKQCNGYVSSLISALVSEDWLSVIQDCHISSWKEALAGIISHAAIDEFPIFCKLLAERLEKENNGNLQLLHDAQLLYICSGNFKTFIERWYAETSTQNPEKLQEIIEMIIFMNKASDELNKYFEMSGIVAHLFKRYAILLISQGNLKTASNYLGNVENSELIELRDRLYCHLGLAPAYIQQQQQQQPARRISNSRQYQSYQKLNSGLSTTQQSWFGQNSVSTSTPVSNSGQYNNPGQYNTNPLQTFSSNSSAPTTHPPRPPSVGSTATRSKYVVDPSVQSNLSSQMGSMKIYSPPVQTQPISSYSNVSSASPMAPVNYTAPPMSNVEVAQPALNLVDGSLTAPGWNDPPALSKASKPQVKPTVTPQAPITHPLFGVAPDPFTSGYPQTTPTSYMNSTIPPQVNNYNQQPQYQQQFSSTPQPVPLLQQTFPPVQQMPPVEQSIPLLQQSVSTLQQSVPPLHQSVPPMQQAPLQSPLLNQSIHLQQTLQQQIPNMQQPLVHPQLSPTPPKAATPELPKPKEPLPEEFMYLQTVFDELRARCSCASNNPQTKRKLEDVARKLESLYDMLRECKLSANTLTGLHQMVQFVQSGDYKSGLNLQTQLISGPDFAQIASFMPGLKVLLQCALQLQVYLT